MTSMNEYWMNAFSQPQNSHSSVGTMKNGTKSGPTRPQTALAIMLKETTNSSANCARPMTISISQYSRFARIDQASGCSSAFQSVFRLCCAFWIDCATDEAGEVSASIRDQVRKRLADAGNRRRVERDHRVAEGDHQQQLGEAEHVLAGLAPGEHHPDAVPDEQDGRERDEHPVADAEELRLLRGQQAGDGLLDGADRVVAGRAASA